MSNSSVVLSVTLLPYPEPSVEGIADRGTPALSPTPKLTCDAPSRLHPLGNPKTSTSMVVGALPKLESIANGNPPAVEMSHSSS